MERLVLNMNEVVVKAQERKESFFEIKEEVNKELSVYFDLDDINESKSLEDRINNTEKSISSLEYISSQEHICKKSDIKSVARMKEVLEHELYMWRKIYTNDDEEKKIEAISMIMCEYIGIELDKKKQFELLQRIRIVFRRTKHKLGLKKATSLSRWLNFLDIAYYHTDEVDEWRTLVIPSKCNNEEECEKCPCNGFCPRGYL